MPADQAGAGSEDRDQSDAEIDPRYMAPGLSRGLALLQLFDRDRPEMKLAELAAAAGMSRSAAFRLVYTLEKENYLHRDPVTRRYGLTSKVLLLGFVYMNSRPLTEIVHPYLRRLSSSTRAAAHLVELDGTYCVYLARVAPAVTLVSNLQVGTRLPAHATVSGRLLLSGLRDDELITLHARMLREHGTEHLPSLKTLVARAREDREHGYTMGESAFDPGVMSFAAPLRDGTGAVVAAINVVGPRNLMEQTGDAAAFDAIVGQEARDLSATLGYSGR
jgi:IclR family pca regulon transcriptional regulator